MHDEGNDGPGGRRDERRGEGQRERGPEGTEFLDLEISKVLYEEAAGLTRAAVRDILREAIAKRLRERLGDRLEAIARLAADELADDVEANLDIEARIAARRQTRAARDAAVQDALFPGKPPREEP
jgi:histone H3/H4